MSGHFRGGIKSGGRNAGEPWVPTTGGRIRKGLGGKTGRGAYRGETWPSEVRYLCSFVLNLVCRNQVSSIKLANNRYRFLCSFVSNLVCRNRFSCIKLENIQYMNLTGTKCYLAQNGTNCASVYVVVQLGGWGGENIFPFSRLFEGGCVWSRNFILFNVQVKYLGLYSKWHKTQNLVSKE